MSAEAKASAMSYVQRRLVGSLSARRSLRKFFLHNACAKHGVPIDDITDDVSESADMAFLATTEPPPVQRHEHTVSLQGGLTALNGLPGGSGGAAGGAVAGGMTGDGMPAGGMPGGAAHRNGTAGDPTAAGETLSPAGPAQPNRSALSSPSLPSVGTSNSSWLKSAAPYLIAAALGSGGLIGYGVSQLGDDGRGGGAMDDRKPSVEQPAEQRPSDQQSSGRRPSVERPAQSIYPQGNTTIIQPPLEQSPLQWLEDRGEHRP